MQWLTEYVQFHEAENSRQKEQHGEMSDDSDSSAEKKHVSVRTLSLLQCLKLGSYYMRKRRKTESLAINHCFYWNKLSILGLQRSG